MNIRLPFRAIASLAIGSSLLAACSSPEPVSRDARQITSAEGDLRGVVDGNNAFAWALYDELRRNDSGNLFFSPFSISAAAAMAYAGARGETASQMRETLRLQIEDDAYHQGFGALLDDLGGPHQGRGYELSIANRLFGQEGFAFQSDFLSLTENAYRAPLKTLDFAGNHEAAREHINAWVSEQTRDRIPDLLAEGSVSSDTRLVLANAIYFNAQWATAFDPEQTREERFFIDAETMIDVPMMRLSDAKFTFAYFESFRALELPYLDEELGMVVLLPDEPDGLSALEEELSKELVDEVVDSLKESVKSKVDISFPKIEVSYDLDLAEPLIAMGIVDAFDEDLADFSGIAERLYLSEAVHQAFVQIDEAGTEAAAATAIGTVRNSGPPSFFADHPFLFFIHDRLTGSVLFIGRVVNPIG